MADNINFVGNKFCLNHLKEEVQFMCENCKEKACNTCVSTIHKGHNLIGINLIVQEKYNRLQDINTDIREIKIPRIRGKLQAAETKVKDTLKKIRSNIETVEEHGQHLKERIDKSTGEIVSELIDLEQKITNQLDEFKYDSESVINRLEELIAQSKNATKSDNNILVVDVEEHLSSQTIQEPEFELKYSPGRYLQGSNPDSDIKAALGTIVYEQLPTEKVVEPVISNFLDLSLEPDSVLCTLRGDLWICGSESNER